MVKTSLDRRPPNLIDTGVLVEEEQVEIHDVVADDEVMPDVESLKGLQKAHSFYVLVLVKCLPTCPITTLRLFSSRYM